MDVKFRTHLQMDIPKWPNLLYLDMFQADVHVLVGQLKINLLFFVVFYTWSLVIAFYAVILALCVEKASGIHTKQSGYCSGDVY